MYSIPQVIRSFNILKEVKEDENEKDFYIGYGDVYSWNFYNHSICRIPENRDE
ncbi:MAG: hypothetical protein KAJ58_00525 [Candidatus Pacebacteria bacterium]|nr:hypothetical protein [Candidatus Paceibacterota bacterium]